MYPVKGILSVERLVLAGRRLVAVIQHNRGGSNKELARFASQINSLCDKWGALTGVLTPFYAGGNHCGKQIIKLPSEQ